MGRSGVRSVSWFRGLVNPGTNCCRFLSLSNPQRPLSTEDPIFESYLPVDDAAWDDEVPAHSPPLAARPLPEAKRC